MSAELVPLGAFLRRVKEPVLIEDDEVYRQVTVRLKHGGVVLRGEQAGRDIATKRQFRIRPGQFILSRIDARNAAFGIVPDELDGAIVTNDFPVYEVTGPTTVTYLNYLTQTDAFLAACVRASTGTTNRQRLNESILLSLEVPFLSRAEQHTVLSKLELVEAILDRLGSARADALALRARLLREAFAA